MAGQLLVSFRGSRPGWQPAQKADRYVFASVSNLLSRRLFMAYLLYVWVKLRAGAFTGARLST
jgi:hypothetical protein